MSDDAVVIVNGARTAMGGFQGSLSAVSAPELGAASIREAVARAGLKAEDVQEVIMGCVLPAGLKQGPARQAMRLAGLPDSTGATTINKLCGSGMKATMFAYDSIKAGTNDIVVSGGMESMTNAPYILEKARAGMRMGHGQVMDHMFLDRANAAVDNGWFKDEIVPVTVKTRKGEVVVDTDEQPGNAKIDKIPTLRPAFAKDGTVTAANASSISDGGSALVLARESVANERGLKPLARILAHATNSHCPHRCHRSGNEESGLERGRCGPVRNQRSLRHGGDDADARSGHSPRESEHPRRRLCPGSPGGLHRLTHHPDPDPRAQAHRRQTRCGQPVYRRR